jgi:hypothetical protein
LLFDKESLFYSIFQSSHTAGKILIDYSFSFNLLSRWVCCLGHFQSIPLLSALRSCCGDWIVWMSMKSRTSFATSWVILFQGVATIGDDLGKSSGRVKHESVQHVGNCKSYRGWRLDCGIQEFAHPQSQILDVKSEFLIKRLSVTGRNRKSSGTVFLDTVPDLSYFSGNKARWRCQIGIFTFLVKEEILGRFESQARASPRFGGCTGTKPRKSLWIHSAARIPDKARTE